LALLLSSSDYSSRVPQVTTLFAHNNLSHMVLGSAPWYFTFVTWGYRNVAKAAHIQKWQNASYLVLKSQSNQDSATCP
jgi:hypothetical protein